MPVFRYQFSKFVDGATRQFAGAVEADDLDDAIRKVGRLPGCEGVVFAANVWPGEPTAPADRPADSWRDRPPML